ncbi:MAG: YaaR family protein [Treponema sp.]|nr:YaaR family protein [Treponema sp.]
MNPAVYSQVKPEKQESRKTKGFLHTKDVGKSDFSRLFDNLRGITADEIGPLKDLPSSEEAVNHLMDEVRSTGDALKSRPLPEEIMRYKQAVRNFINHVVQNTYAVEHEDGILNKFKPQFKGRRNTPEADDWKGYTKIQVIDKKLEDLAAMLLSGQKKQLELVSRLEEIRGLLIDLLH